MAKVSVIICNKNYGQFLREAYVSVLGQTYKDYELVLVDYGSTDDSRESMELLNGLPNVKCIYASGEVSLCEARNKGVEIAEGEYILQLDADDKLRPNFLEEAMRMAGPKTIAATGGAFFGERQGIHIPQANDLSSLRSYNQIFNCSVYPKALWREIGGYDEQLEGYEDWDFWIRALRANYEIVIIKRILVDIRERAGSRNKAAIANHDRLREYILTKK